MKAKLRQGRLAGPGTMRRGGIALVLVLIAAVVAFTISSAYLTSQATTITISENSKSLASARYVAEAGLRIAARYVNRSATWRTDRTHGTWASSVTLSPGTVTVVGYDGYDASGDGTIAQPSEGDGNLADDNTDLLTLIVTGTVSGTTHIARAVLTPTSGVTPIAHWKMNETSGTTADDAVGPYNGTVTAATWTTSGQLNGALNLDGAGDYVTVANASGLQLTTAMSITAWARFDAFGTGSDTDTILRKGEDGPNNYLLAVVGRKLSLVLDASDTAGFLGNTTLNTGTWYHLAGTWDGSLVRLYVNSVLDNTPGSKTGALGTDTRPLYIGGRTGSTDETDGRLDDVRFYNRALTAAEISQAASGTGYTIAGAVTPVASITTPTTGTTHTAAAGSNRLLVVVVGMESISNRTVSALTYGGRALTQIATAVAGGVSGAPYDRVSLYYLNEANIAAASSSTISLTWSGSVDDSFIHASMVANVNQTSPIRSSTSLDIDAATPNPIVSSSFTVAAGDLAVAGAIGGNASQAYTWNNSFTEGTDQSGTTSQMSSAGRSITAGTTSVAASATNAGPNRQAIVAAALTGYTAPSTPSGEFDVRWTK